MITLQHIQRTNNNDEDTHLYISTINDWQLNTYPGTWKPAVDVYENDNFIIVRMEIAGMQESDFKITICQQRISISGFRSDRSEKKAFQQMEIIYGEFKAEVEISSFFITEGAKAFYTDGFLNIKLPKGKIT